MPVIHPIAAKENPRSTLRGFLVRPGVVPVSYCPTSPEMTSPNSFHLSPSNFIS
jgi:hypothetical protein